MTPSNPRNKAISLDGRSIKRTTAPMVPNITIAMLNEMIDFIGLSLKDDVISMESLRVYRNKQCQLFITGHEGLSILFLENGREKPLAEVQRMIEESKSQQRSNCPFKSPKNAIGISSERHLCQ
ncbi:hypothetical protein JCM39068_22700 [Desulfocastanea catecholica]